LGNPGKLIQNFFRFQMPFSNFQFSNAAQTPYLSESEPNFLNRGIYAYKFYTIKKELGLYRRVHGKLFSEISLGYHPSHAQKF